MRFFASLPDDPQPRELEVRALGGNQFSVRLDGVEHTLDFVPHDGDAVSVLVNGQGYAVDIDAADLDAIQVRVRGATVTVDLADERRMRRRAASGLHGHDGPQVIAAPMPGKVVKVLAKVGDEVAAGQGLVVVEAMKMENELKSPRAGKVTEVQATEGQSVERGAKLMTVE